jgi:YD repeat-containing protein
MLKDPITKSILYLEPNIQNVKKGLLTGGLKSDDVAIVFDIDGTLTDLPEPEEGVVPGKRPGAVELIQELSRNHFNIVASSAWSTFHTPETLRSLGLTREFGIIDSHTVSHNNVDVKIKDNFGEEHTFKYNQFGNAVSVKEGNVKFFRHKALAPYIALCPKPLEQLN